MTEKPRYRLKRSPVPRVNRKRAAKRHKDAFGSTGKAEYVRSLPCIACEAGGTEQATRTEACHARSRGAGGKAEALVPLCTSHHLAQHWMGARTFENRTGLDLMFVAARVEMDWQAQQRAMVDVYFQGKRCF